jgi:hypothetical protein
MPSASRVLSTDEDTRLDEITEENHAKVMDPVATFVKLE